MNITIPVPIARLAVASAWYAAVEIPANRSASPADYPQATRMAFRRSAESGRSRWPRDVHNPTTDFVQHMLEGVNAVRSEHTARHATWPALEQFADLLRDRLDMLREEEAKQAELERQRIERSAAENRISRGRRREKPLSGSLEVERNPILNEIAEDYGLDIKDPQIRAGLITAWRAGASAHHQAVNFNYYQDPREVPKEWMDKRKATDKTLFDKARAAAGATPDTDNT